jgi:hypothetical protein
MVGEVLVSLLYSIPNLLPARRGNPPAHIHWRFGGKSFSHRAHSRSGDFQYRLVPSLEKRCFSFRDEVMRACALLDQKRGNRPIALCYTGGIDSELIARALHLLGIPFELYFLDIWGLNIERFRENSARFLSEIGKTARIVRLEQTTFYENHSLEIYRRFGCDQPTHLALTYLFEQIPKCEFIVVGDGDLHREGELFSQIAKIFGQQKNTCGKIPYSSSSTFFYSWQGWSRRRGEFYFFSSTPEIIAAAYTDPHFSKRFPIFSTREMIYRYFPEIRRREKTTNWDGTIARKENKWIRAWLHRESTNAAFFSRSEKGPFGCLVDLDEIFLFEPNSD